MSYIGLRASVKYRRELGFVFVDDGKRLFKIDGMAFQKIEDSSRGECMDASIVEKLINKHSSIFCIYSQPDKAQESFINQEI